MLEKLRKVRQERAEGDKGFTLIELLVVVVIIGILIAIAIPLYLNYEKGAKNKSAQSDVRNAVTAVEQCVADNGGSVAGITAAGGANGATLVLTCGTSGTENSNVSSGNTVTFAINTTPAGTYTVTGVNADGGKTYTYNSANGGKVS